MIMYRSLEKYRYRLLDSFMTDAISRENLEIIFANRKKVPVQILLAHPDSEFASIRAHARDRNFKAEELTKRGLLAIASALGKQNIPTLEKKDAAAVLESLTKATKSDEFEIRFYNDSPSSPLYFLCDLVLVGRFGTGTSSAHLRWEMIVDDPSVDNDVYDILLREFNLLWRESFLTLEPLNQVSQVPQESENLDQVFISYSSQDRGVALELKELFENKDIRAFVAELDIMPGDNWSEEIRQNLASCREIVLILSQHSEESHWVMAECGAAWALNKTITPATIGCNLSNTMQFVSQYQSIEIADSKGKQKLIDAVCSRIRNN